MHKTDVVIFTTETADTVGVGLSMDVARSTPQVADNTPRKFRQSQLIYSHTLKEQVWRKNELMKDFKALQLSLLALVRSYLINIKTRPREWLENPTDKERLLLKR